MNIKILTPEAVIFDGEVDSVLLPGKNGDFHIKKGHAPIVSSLIGGPVRLFTNSIAEGYAKNFTKEADASSVFAYAVKSGVVEFNNDKGIILAE